MSSDPELLNWILGIGATAVTGVSAALYRATHGRIKRTEEATEKKADKESVEHMREDIQALWREVNDQRRDMNGGFESVRKDLHAAHLDLAARFAK